MRGDFFGNPRGPVIRMEASNSCDSDGNRVNVGNFDDKDINVNNNLNSNRNSNLGVASARQSSLSEGTPAHAGVPTVAPSLT